MKQEPKTLLEITARKVHEDYGNFDSIHPPALSDHLYSLFLYSGSFLTNKCKKLRSLSITEAPYGVVVTFRSLAKVTSVGIKRGKFSLDGGLGFDLLGMPTRSRTYSHLSISPQCTILEFGAKYEYLTSRISFTITKEGSKTKLRIKPRRSINIRDIGELSREVQFTKSPTFDVRPTY